MARPANFQNLVNGLLAQLGKAVARGVAEGIERSGLLKQTSTSVRSSLGKRGPKPGSRRRGTHKTCSMAGCDLPARSKGLCSKHYQSERNRARKEGGSTAATGLKKSPLKKKATKTKIARKAKGVARRAAAKKASPKKKVQRAVTKKASPKKPAPVAARKNKPGKRKATRHVMKKALPKKVTPAVELNPPPQNGTAVTAETQE